MSKEVKQFTTSKMKRFTNRDVPMGHNKKGSVRKSQHRAGLVSLDHPRNQVQAVLNLWRALLK